MSELTLIVRMVAKQNLAGKLEAALRAAIAPTHAETGCIRYALHRSTQDAGVLVLIERWASQQALDEHMAQPFLKKLLAEIQELSQSVDVAQYTMLADGDPTKLL